MKKTCLCFEINGKREYRIFKSYNDETQIPDWTKKITDGLKPQKLKEQIE